jgi:hypothetical protein
LCAGGSGSGKSWASKGIINILNKQYRYPPMCVLDSGGRDFPQALATETDKITQAIDYVYYIAEGRRREPLGTNFQRLVIVGEEFEVYFSEMKLLKKQDYDKFIHKFSRLILTCRKLKITWLLILQTASSGDSIPTAIKSNIANNFYMRMGKNAATHVHKLKWQLDTLESGVALYDRIENFVQFDPLLKEPHINALTWDQLKDMAEEAIRKHGLTVDSVD